MTQDNRVIVEIELEDELLYRLMIMAHEQDITLNQLVQQILQKYLDDQDHTSPAV